MQAFSAKLILILSLFLFSNKMLAAQNSLAVGKWRTHFNYSNSLLLVEADFKYYCASTEGLYAIIKNEFTLQKLSTEDGFSGNQAVAMRYNKEYDLLFIAYNNNLIDIVSKNRISSLNAIERSTVSQVKEIYDFNFHEDKVYVSTSFGLVVYDLTERDFTESYIYIGKGDSERIGEITTFYDSKVRDNFIYALTEDGLIRAPLDQSLNLQDHRNWTLIKQGSGNEMEIYKDHLYFNMNDTVYSYGENTFFVEYYRQGDELRNLDVSDNHLMLSTDQKIFIHNGQSITDSINDPKCNQVIRLNSSTYLAAGERFGVRYWENKEITRYMNPNGPADDRVYSARYMNGKVFFSSGGFNSSRFPAFRTEGYYEYKNERWENYRTEEISPLPEGKDIMDVVESADGRTRYIASFLRGLIRERNGEYDTVFNYSNSALSFAQLLNDTEQVRVAALDYDRDGNLWMTNNLSDSPLVVKSTNNKWYSYSTNGNNWLFDMEVDSNNQIWAVNNGNATKGIVVYNTNGTLADRSDDQFARFSTGATSGNLPSETVYSLTVDRRGELWIGTADGVAVIYNTFNAFNGAQAQRILIQSGGQAGYLLEGQQVNDIKVDGGNRKWMATNSGVWLVSEDGTEILYNFNEDNSPLSSNTVNELVVNNRTGEVFMATAEGIVSFRSEAAAVEEVEYSAYTFPNPVRPYYNGPITISGLNENSIVKIADVNGSIVFEMISTGAQAVWYGSDFNGNRVSSGVYFVMNTNEFGESKIVSKILIVR